MKHIKHIKFSNLRSLEALIFLTVFFAVFGYMAHVMTLPNMLNTLMNTSYHLLLDTVFYIMGITVLSGALGALLIEFGSILPLFLVFHKDNISVISSGLTILVSADANTKV